MSDTSIFGSFRIIHLIHLVNILNGMHQIGCTVKNKKMTVKVLYFTVLRYIRSSEIDIVKFTGEYNGKRIEIGIRKYEWEVWLRIWHLTGNELNVIEDELGLT